MTKYEIVEQLARDREVESLIKNTCKVSRSDLDDLAQLIYEALLNYDEVKIQRLHEEGAMTFFLVRIIRNQFYSMTSPYYHLYRELLRMSVSEQAAYQLPANENE